MISVSTGFRFAQSLLLVAATLATCAWKAPDPAPQTPPPRPPSAFVLAQATPLPVAQLHPEEWKRCFPAFTPSATTTEYSHLVLPFTGGPTEADQMKAYAFSFLLSNALDWGPGCYCSRHAYFTFKRSGLAAVDAGKTLRPTAIQALAKHWKATHVIGGEIHAVSNGFTGTLKVFAPDGSLLKEVPCNTARPYFTLLGDMSADALAALGWQPPAALAEHLRVPRCQDEGLLVDLGRAAFAEERSETEFGIYRRILEQEPGFAEVRYWWANQAMWAGGDARTFQREMLRSVRSYLTLTAMEDADWQAAAGDPGLNIPALLEKMTLFCGPDSPVAWRLRFKTEDPRRPSLSIRDVQSATAVAARYPQNHKLLMTLTAPGEDGPWRNDASMVASIALAVQECRTLPSSLARNSAAYDLANAANRLGYNHMAAQLMGPLTTMAMRQRNSHDFHVYGNRLAKMLQDMGQYEESFGLGKLVLEAADAENRPFDLLELVIAGVILGKTNQVDALVKQWGTELPSKPMAARLLHAYLALGKGDDRPALTYIREERVGPGDASIRLGMQMLMLCAEMDFRRGTAEFQKTIRAAHCQFPASRPLWILLDAYDKRAPLPEEEGFYEALGYMHTYDPWVREAMHQRALRVAHPRVFNLETTLAALDMYGVSPWPMDHVLLHARPPHHPFTRPPRWEYTCAIFTLLDMREYDRADEFTRQCLAMAKYQGGPDSHFNHLYHLVQAARRADPAPPARKLPPPAPPERKDEIPWNWPAGITNLPPCIIETPTLPGQRRARRHFTP